LVKTQKGNHGGHGGDTENTERTGKKQKYSLPRITRMSAEKDEPPSPIRHGEQVRYGCPRIRGSGVGGRVQRPPERKARKRI